MKTPMIDLAPKVYAKLYRIIEVMEKHNFLNEVYADTPEAIRDINNILKSDPDFMENFKKAIQ